MPFLNPGGRVPKFTLLGNGMVCFKHCYLLHRRSKDKSLVTALLVTVVVLQFLRLTGNVLVQTLALPYGRT